MLNQVSLIGRITKDPQLRFTNSGVAYVKLHLAIQRRYRNTQGEFDADFVPCIIWRKQAESTANYCHKGALVSITGRIQTRYYLNDQNERTYVTEIIGDDVRFLKLQAATTSSSTEHSTNDATSTPTPS
ncbi:single-stranded DNA-binding protein [Geomicrobium sp. JCM 19039]|uniref:single-stranded DNA-binding protein n=1 Tax=Geomicrobium sp. JCM 19039 TaxID=1460636 RepID=UPI00045F326C|nr:single-stranded DNA-binding protein [Geomicrobium sp. JCM 19039]GAK11590.1 single-stranded DNA-binding protein [Geomicrobium sp. JCM 19039]